MSEQPKRFLQVHLDAIEKLLMAQSNIAQNAENANLRGGPREWFIKEYLASHLSGLFEIGQGDIIEPNTLVNSVPDRHQNDIVIYRKDFPRIPYSAYDCAYLIDGVKATIEVKSRLAKDDLLQACGASKQHKELQPSEMSDNLYSYLIAYSGNIDFVCKTLNMALVHLETTSDKMLDMIIILNKGVIWRIGAFHEITPSIPKNKNWAFIKQTDGNIYFLFSHMMKWCKFTPLESEFTDYFPLSPVLIGKEVHYR